MNGPFEFGGQLLEIDCPRQHVLRDHTAEFHSRQPCQLDLVSISTASACGKAFGVKAKSDFARGGEVESRRVSVRIEEHAVRTLTTYFDLNNNLVGDKFKRNFNRSRTGLRVSEFGRA